ncbi:unnamed protein product [Hermetia illucens]|uniref:Glycosyl transferase family 25 domain-containing protein n=1 Tax=Hermetia illucens TaxID=343691 RepID=A0A7R8UH32_HERIL|nr:glycosyltransferase 25 family member [Hermetia illucens]CAD7080575.1 unnamed protein product [Hermetia illucens]
MLEMTRCLTIAIVIFVISTQFTRVLPDGDAGANVVGNGDENLRKDPSVFILILVRNKEHTLPYFLTYLEKLNYPKHRLSLWIRSDHNEDRSIEILQKWVNRTSSSYHSVDFEFDSQPGGYQNESSPTDWPKERFKHLIYLKNKALERAQKMWADFILFLDADTFLTDPNALRYLTAYDVPIVSPMLRSDGLYSNYWCGMTEDNYYKRTDEYKEIYEYKKVGNFPVPMVHSVVLVNLNYAKTALLTFDPDELVTVQRHLDYTKLYKGPTDDIIVFAVSARSIGLEMLISNEHQYGYLLSPLEKEEPIEREYQQFINTKVNIVNDIPSGIVEIEDYLQEYIQYPEIDRVTLDKIYMINLLRRPERRIKMEKSFRELGLEVEHFPAVDGRDLSLDIIEKMGIRFLPGYEDPYHHRQMTMGEIGCFLSHYKIWEKMVELEQKEVLILEDDIRFEPFFKDKAIQLLEEARFVEDWDLIYFGRKRLEDEEEPYVDGANNLVYVGYSYWTLGYVISLSGAKKLLAVDPLRKLIPVDEFLPVMFDRHPNKTWSNAFEPRNLIAFSAAPLILFPTHYTGDDGYISDTEDSVVTPLTYDLATESNAQLKSDKGRENSSDSFIDDQEIDNKHKSASNVLIQEIRDGVAAASKHDANEL